MACLVYCSKNYADTITSYLQESQIIFVVVQIGGLMLEVVVKSFAQQDTTAQAPFRNFPAVVGIIFIQRVYFLSFDPMLSWNKHMILQ